MNTGDGKFVDVSRRCGNGLAVVESSRGTGFDDLDNDGDVDVVVLNSQAPPTLIRNESDTGNHWLQVQLHGVRSNRDGVGARVELLRAIWFRWPRSTADVAIRATVERGCNSDWDRGIGSIASRFAGWAEPSKRSLAWPRIGLYE